MDSEFVNIPGYDGYMINKQGDVISFRKKCTGKIGTTYRQLKPAYNTKTRYLFCVLRKNGKSYTITIHKLVAMTFLGDNCDGLEIRHLDGISTNNHVSNLAYGTRKDNAQDMVKHNQEKQIRQLTRIMLSESKQRNLLRAEIEKRAIQTYQNGGITLKDAAKMCGISESGMCRLVKGNRRPYLTQSS